MSPRRPAHGLLLALVSVPALAVAACQVSLPGSQPPPPTVAPVSGSPLAAADAKVYSGNYDEAETAYKSLISMDVAGATAHYATLLDYEGRYRDAVAEAQRAVQRAPTSDALGRLCRALDWAN